MLKSKSEQIIGNNYRLKRKIGSGSFGEIYEAESIKTKTAVAIKFELLNASIPQLEYESKIYTILTGGPGIPQVKWFGKTQTHSALVIDLLGKSLEDLLQMSKHPFSLKTVLMLADQMLCTIQFIHNKNFIHRDIKPDNFVMGLGQESNSLFIIDFGLAKKYQDPITHRHISYSEGKTLTGTARYASIGALRGIEQSRRDDLESLAYVLIYLLKGSLPWMGLDAASMHEKYDKILKMKTSIPVDELCYGLPDEFAQFLKAIKKLKFDERPKYSHYRKLFRNLFIQSGYVYNYKYDWTLSSKSQPPIPKQHTKLKDMKVRVQHPKGLQKASEKMSNVTNGQLSCATLPSTIIVKDESIHASNISDKTLSSSSDEFNFDQPPSGISKLIPRPIEKIPVECNQSSSSYSSSDSFFAGFPSFKNEIAAKKKR